MTDTIKLSAEGSDSIGDRPSPLSHVPSVEGLALAHPAPLSLRYVAFAQAETALAAEAWQAELAEMSRLWRQAQRRKYEAESGRRLGLASRLFHGFQRCIESLDGARDSRRRTVYRGRNRRQPLQLKSVHRGNRPTDVIPDSERLTDGMVDTGEGRNSGALCLACPIMRTGIFRRVQASRSLSFPEIISARSDDAALTEQA